VTARQLSPECRLVFRTASVSFAPGDIAVLAADVRDWARVVALAEREMATSLVTRHLVANPRVPDDALDELRRRTVGLDLRMQYLSRKVQRLCAVFAERQIPLMLLKGAAVGALVDPTFLSRPMKDVDILVRREDVGRASDAIVASGWAVSPDDVLRDLLAEAHHLPPFIDLQMPGIRVELHIAHLPAWHPFDFDVDGLWQRAWPAPAPFTGALIPSPNDLLLHASIHFAWQHPMVFGAWRTFRAVSAMHQREGFDWLQFVGAAGAAKAVTACYWTLRLGNRLSGINVPDHVLERLKPPTPEWVLGALERHFISNIALGEMPESPSFALDRALWSAAIRPRWSGHGRPREWDPENKWAQAYGSAATESAVDRIVRHTRTYRRWTDFVTKTLFG
jgi:hypothetical protein